VLVVDDNEDAADALAQLVRLSGHEADVAYNGMCALARVRTLRPDIVLCDLGLPELSGFDFARAIRREHARSIRLVAISGYAQPGGHPPRARSRLRCASRQARAIAEIESLFIRFSGS
jgi:CheY-like chemotaxis protein